MTSPSAQKPHPHNRPIIGITMGDPLGIGPEILVKALHGNKLHDFCRPLVIGDSYIIQLAFSQFSIPLVLNQITRPEQGRYKPGCLDLMPVSAMDVKMPDLTAMTPEIGQAMADYIHTGVDLAMTRKTDALVTCPITKTGLKMAGSPFHGHTELIAHQTRTLKFAMMLAGKTLKVVLVTIHIPLAQVSKTLTRDKIADTILLTYTALKTRFNIPHPRLAVAGLNPHAGEDTLFGTEEQNIIAPAVRAARQQGMNITGPLPPDTVFNHALNTGCDAVICMYHDQGLIPFKLIHFKDGVNITLGLPIIRTSVDHGTAYDIAWQGKAEPDSLIAAVKLAVFQAHNQTDPGTCNG
ncbi:MAG: 4-hydroxythreonine-4-phosphate dehydrogenase PdxA [Desulfotignum sp.]|nr:4-hydroxythreonine-4-phosphate dehydrogenase PdxA [Desulfotignum sp.]